MLLCGFVTQATSVSSYADFRKANAYLSLTLMCEQLPKMDVLGWCDAYLQLFKLTSDMGEDGGGGWDKFYETEVVKNNATPLWEPIVVKPKKVAPMGDEMLLIKVWDWNRNAASNLIGEIKLSFMQLKQEGAIFPIFNAEEKQKNPAYQHSGFLKIIFAKNLTKNPLRHSSMDAGTSGALADKLSKKKKSRRSSSKSQLDLGMSTKDLGRMSTSRSGLLAMGTLRE